MLSHLPANRATLPQAPMWRQAEIQVLTVASTAVPIKHPTAYGAVV